MIKINLEQEFKTFDGKIIKQPDGKTIILKNIILNNIGLMKSIKGEDAIKNMSLGIKLNGLNGIVELEDNEIDIIKTAIEQNASGNADIIRGQALKMLEAC